MKTKLLALVATLGMVASASAVKINNNLSINGFIDGSYQMVDNSGNTPDTQSLSVDEVELDFIVNVSNVSGELHLDSGPTFGAGGANEVVEVEQAHITYSLDNGISFTFGKYGSGLGFEREDPAGLYTFSRAYGDSNTNNKDHFNFGNVDANAVEGLTVAYSAGDLSLAASIESASGQSREVESNDLNLELAFTYTGFNNVVLGGGFFFDNQADSADENDAMNIHASRQFGKLLLAAEYSEIQNTVRDRDAYLLLADYDFNDKVGVAVRFSNNEQSKADQGDYEKFTIAPNYAITESLGAIFEYSDVENNNAKTEEYAVELTYTF
jgi:predicted porin